MNKTVQKWFSDPEFQSLSLADQQRAVGGYFDENLGNNEAFSALKPEDQRRARVTFVERNMAPNQPPAPARGWVGDVGTAVGRAALGAGEMFLQAGAAVYDQSGYTPEIAESLRETAKDVAGYKQEALPLSQQSLAGGVRGAVTGGVESALTSLAVKGPAAAAGFLAGGPVGAALGWLSGVPLFSMAQYETSLQGALDKGLDRESAEQAAVLEAASEGGFELLTDVIEIMTLGTGGAITQSGKQAARQAVKKVLGAGWKQAVKKGLTVAGAESAGELMNVGTQAEIEQHYDLGDQRFWGAVTENFGSIGVASLIFGSLGGGLHLANVRATRKTLEDPSAGFERRAAAVEQVAAGLTDYSPSLARQWRQSAMQAVLAGEPISVDGEIAPIKTDAVKPPPPAPSAAAADPIPTGPQASGQVADAAALAAEAAKKSEQQAVEQNEVARQAAIAQTAAAAEAVKVQGEGQEVEQLRSGEGEMPPATAELDLDDLRNQLSAGQRMFIEDTIGRSGDPAAVLAAYPDDDVAGEYARRLAATVDGGGQEVKGQEVEKLRSGEGETPPKQPTIDEILQPVIDKAPENVFDARNTFVARVRQKLNLNDEQTQQLFLNDDYVNIAIPEIDRRFEEGERNFIGMANQFADKISEKLGAGKPKITETIDLTENTGRGAHQVPEKKVPAKKTLPDQGHDYSSTQVNLPEGEAKAVRNLARTLIADDDVYTREDDDSYGREENPHITVKYGLHTADPEKIKALIKDQGPITAKLGKTVIFEGDDHDVVVAEVDSPELHALNKKISSGTEVTDTYPDYKPHVTLAYVKKGRGENYDGEDFLEGREITFDSLTFSGKDGKNTEIQLAAKKETEIKAATKAVQALTGKDIVAKSGKPYQNKNAAAFALRSKKLTESHEVVAGPDGGFVIRAIAPAAETLEEGKEDDTQTQGRLLRDQREEEARRETVESGGTLRQPGESATPTGAVGTTQEKVEKPKKTAVEVLTGKKIPKKPETIELTENTGRGAHRIGEKTPVEKEAVSKKSESDLIKRYRVYERELDKKLKEHGNVSAAETHALASSGLLQEGVAAARSQLGLPNTMKPGTPLMAREAKGEEKAPVADLDTEVENLSDEDLDRMLDDAGKEPAAETEQPAKPPKAPAAPREKRAPTPAAAPRPLSSILEDAAKEGMAGAEEALKGLYDLFGGGALKSFPGGIDEDTYAKAKPHFQSAYDHMKASGKNLKDFFQFVVERFGKAIKPYLKRFVNETKAAIKASKEARGKFENVGYVYDPEDLNKSISGKEPKTAVRIILDKMTPGKIWSIAHPDGTTPGTIRMLKATQPIFKSFKEFVETRANLGRYSYRRVKRIEDRIANWMEQGGHTVEELKAIADEYAKTMAPVVNSYNGKTTILDAIGSMQHQFLPGAMNEDGTFPEKYYDAEVFMSAAQWDTDFLTRSTKGLFYNFLTKDWQKFLAEENDTLLSEINIHQRTRNKEIVRSGLPDYREGRELLKSEDLQEPFNFNGVGYGTAGWINQDERRRVVHAAYDAFKDLAAAIGAPDNGMGLGGGLAVQFANLGHKAKGAAAAYFPAIKTINFTRDSGDGTMAHEWGHGFHYLAAADAKTQLENLISDFYFTYDFDAGMRMADDLMAVDSTFMKRVVNTKKQSRLDYIKAEVKKRYEDAVKKETNYYKTALEMENDYTQRRTEMWARAFESYIYDNLSGRNNYLVNDFVEAGRIGGKGKVGSMLVYPVGKEREAFGESIAHFLDGLQWDESGLPSMKDDYVELETLNEQKLQEELDKLLDQIEERYKAIWTSEPSGDGNFWYRYDVTTLAPMMQPDGYVGYDKKYKGEGQQGTGAVAYLTQMHPDDILGYKLTNIQYDGNATYISPEGGGINDGFGEEGERSLDEVPARPDGGPEEGRDIRNRDQESGGDGEEGTVRPGKQRGADRGEQGDRDEGIHSVAAGNYRITDATLNAALAVSDRFNSNLAAIKVLRQTEEEDRSPTAAEKDILAGYTGWGGMSELFAWSPGKSWAARSDLIKAELTEDEIERAAESSISSYYTPVPVADFMWKLAQRLGFNSGPMLDPAFGANGVFSGTMPAEFDATVSIHGVEKDELSTRIAKKLYELANIENLGFEDAKKPLNRFNLTITNIPFANYSPADPKHNKPGYKIHNYYINKMLDLTAPGGLNMVIATSNTMDSAGPHLNEYAQKADLVGAIRLPSDLYSATSVVTDILVFRKKIQGSDFVGIPLEDWTTAAIDTSTDIKINTYFIKHPDMVAGKMEVVAGKWGDEKLRIVKEQDDIGRSLAARAAAFPENIVELEVKAQEISLDDMISAPGTIKEGGIYINSGGQVAEKVDGQEVLWPTKTPAEKKTAEIGRGFIKILDQVRTVLRAQKENLDESTVLAEQDNLKTYYKAFVKKFGAINDPKNQKVYNFITDAPWVMSLEEYDPDSGKVVRLADLFTKKIVGTEKRPDFANTDHDALAMALDEFGYPNLEYMARLRNTDPETVLKGVLDKIIENPATGTFETMDEYLSGNVRQKLAAAREMAKANPEYERNVKLLEAALPEDIPPHRIVARIGASWVSPEHLADFVREKINMRGDLTPVFSFNPVTYEWSMSFKGRSQGWKGEVKAETQRAIERYKKSVESKSVWGTTRMNFFTLMDHAIQGKRPVVTYIAADKKVYIDEIATTGAEAKLQEIQTEFNRWLFAYPQRAEEASRRFNDLVNTSTKSQYDGSHLTFPGKSLAVLTAKEAQELGVDSRMTFYDHQVNAVWQYLRNGNLYLAHEVGAGKTMTMALIGMEAKRLKGKKKVLYVTLNDSTMGQAVEEIKRLYPLANIMPVQVSTIAERQRRALQKMALNEFDIAIMRQQDFDRIDLSPEAERVFIDQDLQELRVVLEEAKAAGARILEQDIQVRIADLEAKLKKPGTFAKAKEDQKIYFDDIGIDLLIVDEAHQYKNIPYATRLNRITGLNPAGSKTAHSFFRKTQYLNAQFPKQDGIVLASGTPLTNSIGEFFNLQRVLQPIEAKRQGQWRFDRWIANYGDIGSQLEWDGARQRHREVTTNRRIVNAGRLLATAFQNIDSVRADDTKIVRPKIRGGKPRAVSINPNQYVEHYKEVVLDRLREIEMDPKKAEFDGTPDNMLRIISNMSAVAIDQRLLTSKNAAGETIPGPYADTELQEDSKIYQASRTIYRRYNEESENKGVQLVFADIGVPGRFMKRFKYKTDEQLEKLTVEQLEKYNEEKYESENSALGFNTYDGLKDELVKLGIPRNQIAFIHDADHSNKEKKASNLRKLFKRVNDGDVRVLIGSTTKAGTGVNVQERVSDIHHIDVWWNYSAWEQRNGRGLRAGNIYALKEGVNVWNYVTETTVDAHRWGKIFAKGRVLHTALSGDINVDVIDDISEEVASAKEMEAMASGNPLLLKQATLIQKTRTLALERSSYLDTVRDARMQLASMPQQIRSLESRIDSNTQSRAIMEKLSAVRFVGSDTTLVLDKHGKEISQALAEAVEKTRPSKDSGWWDKEKREPLLAFGTHTETEVMREVDGKQKKVKEYSFQPSRAQALITSADKDYARRWLLIRNGITSGEANLADFSKSLGAKKPKPAEITGNVSRALTGFVSGLDKAIENSNAEIADLNGKKPSLEKVVATPWPKENELAQSQVELTEVEAQMAAGPQGADPAKGLPIREYKAPVPMLDDFAPKSGWSKLGTIIFQSGQNRPQFALDREQFDIPKFFSEQRKKFTPSYTSYAPISMEVLTDRADPGPVVQRPKMFTTIDGVTKFWVRNGPIYFSIEPNAWMMVDRIVGDSGQWHYRSYDGDTYLVHHSEKGAKEAFIRINLERNVPEGIKTVRAAEGDTRLAVIEFPGQRPAGSAAGTDISRRAIETLTAADVDRIQQVAPLVKEAFKKAGLSQEVIDKIDVDLKPIVDLRGKDVQATLDQWAAEGKTISQILGATTFGRYQALMQLSLEQDLDSLERTTFHEAFHVAARWLLPAADYETVMRHYKTEEGAAEAFADYLQNRGTPQPGPLRAIWLKIKRVLELLGNALRGKGFTRPQDVWGQLISGLYRPHFGRGSPAGTVTAFTGIEPYREPGPQTLLRVGSNNPLPQPGSPQWQRDFEADRTFANRIFEQRDIGVHLAQVETAELQKQVQALAGDKSRRKHPLGFAYDKKLKRSRASDQLDMAMMVARDLGANPAKAAEFRLWAADQLNSDINAVKKEQIKDQLALVDQAENLTAEQRALVDQVGERFDQAYQIAAANKVVTSFVDNYVRRIWRFPKNKKDSFGGSGSGYGFKVSTTARKQRKLDTILDGWMEGYELAVKGITNSYGNYMAELETILANKDFVVAGYGTRDADGNRLFSTTAHKGYAPLNAAGFKVWEWAGTAEAEAAPDGSQALLIDDHGRKFFYGPVERIPDTWAVYKINDKGIASSRALRLFLDEDQAKEFAASKDYDTRIDFRAAKDVGTAWEQRHLYAPAPLAEIINKMTKADQLFSGTPGLAGLGRFNAGIKSWILLSSFFHHVAGSRSWGFAVHHRGFRKKDYQNPITGEMETAAGFNMVKAYKMGLEKINERSPLIRLGIKNGLTIGEMQDWGETLLRNEKGYAERIANHLGLVTASKAMAAGRFQREQFTNSLFKKFFAGLKAEAFVMEFVHELQKETKAGQAVNVDKTAEKVARLINADFGGLHLGRMGRNPTLQKMLRLLLLAPDWCSSFDTRALTKTGWKYHHELEVGKDEIVAFDPETQTCKWVVLKDMYVNRSYAGPVVKIKNHRRAVVMTPAHTCYVYNISKKKYETVAAERLNTAHRIPRSAPFDTPQVATYSDKFVKLVGWLATDGYVKSSTNQLADGSLKEYRYGKIVQSKPTTVKMLQDMGLSFHVDRYNSDHGKYKANFPKHVFNIPNEDFREMESIGVDGQLNADFLARLTLDQLTILYDTMMLADGTGQRRFAGNAKKTLGMTLVQVMLGMPTTFYRQEESCWRVRALCHSKRFISCATNKTEEKYRGGIWCPSVETGFWLAEREGLMFITGNTESNFRTVTGMIPGLNKKISEWTGDIAPPPGMDKLYRQFWGRIALRIAVSTVLLQMLLNGPDDTEEFWKEQALSDRISKKRWLEVDISKIYQVLGIDTEGVRKTFSVGGHFFDPLKIFEPFTLVKHKTSPLVRAIAAIATGTDWRERPYRRFTDLIGARQTVKKSPYEKKEGEITRLPAVAIDQIISMQPIQLGYFLRWLQGEDDALSALAGSAGMRVSQAWPPRKEGTAALMTGNAGIDAEIQRLDSAGVLKMGPPASRIMVNAMPYKLNPAQYGEYVDIVNEIVDRRLSPTVASAGWAATSDAAKARIISRVVKNARKTARSRLRRKHNLGQKN